MAPIPRKPQAAAAEVIAKTPSDNVSPPEGVNGIPGNHRTSVEGSMQPEPPKDATYLEQKKQALRAQFTVHPLGPEELQRLEDARWALQDPDVLAHYRGEFVVPYQRQIVAHGTEAAAVLAEAARIVGLPPDDLSLVGVIDPLLDMPR